VKLVIERDGQLFSSFGISALPSAQQTSNAGPAGASIALELLHRTLAFSPRFHAVCIRKGKMRASCRALGRWVRIGLTISPNERL
jgi:hypothetical protein